MTIEELLKDAAFTKELDALDDCEDIAKLFQSRGVEISAEEISEAMKMAEAKVNGELSEENLDNVAGGSLAAIGIALLVGYLVGKASNKRYR